MSCAVYAVRSIRVAPVRRVGRGTNQWRKSSRKTARQSPWIASGSGPALILVDGAMCSRGFGPMPPLAKQLASQFTVFHYDRRGRGDSGDGFAIRRAARDRRPRRCDAAGRRIRVGASAFPPAARSRLKPRRSCAAFAGSRSTKRRSSSTTRTSRCRPPSSPTRRALVAAGKRGDAVKKFMRLVGMPAIGVFVMSVMPFWKKIKAIAHTLANDLDHHRAASPGPARSPRASGRCVTMPALVMAGGKSPAYMQNAMRTGRCRCRTRSTRRCRARRTWSKMPSWRRTRSNFSPLHRNRAAAKELPLSR